MSKVTIKDLLEAGVHFGHQTRRWNPKMARFIFGERNGIYIINLEKTLLCLEDAQEFLTQVATAGKEILFVGTKKQGQAIIQENAEKCGMPYVVYRWLGGMLTNFETIRKSITRMKEISRMEEDGSLDVLTKKEKLVILKERDKMKKNLEGIKDMKKTPGAVVIIDTLKEDIALREARKLHIPVIAVVDTNSDPDIVDYPIPGNDDALRSISLICGALADAVSEGGAGRKKASSEDGKKSAKKSSIKEKKTEGEEADAPQEEQAPSSEETPVTHIKE